MKKIVWAFGLCLLFLAIGVGCYVYVNHQAAKDYQKLDAVSISRTGSFELGMSPEKALPLFTAPGEKLWIPIWKPIILKGDGFEKGTVFVTINHGHETNWLVIDYDIKTNHALYARVTPGVNMGTVDVSLTANGKGGSIVNVSYQLTSLKKSQNDKLADSYSEENYAKMMVEWRDMINGSKENIDQHFSQ